MTAICCRCRDVIEGTPDDPMVITQSPPAIWCAGCARYAPVDETTQNCRAMLSGMAKFKVRRRTLGDLRASGE